MEYRDCIVLVTGDNSGIGRAFVDRFVGEGGKVIACGRDEALKADHPNAEVRRCDIASHPEVEAVGRNNRRALRRMSTPLILSPCLIIVAPGIRAAPISSPSTCCSGETLLIRHIDLLRSEIGTSTPPLFNSWVGGVA